MNIADNNCQARLTAEIVRIQTLYATPAFDLHISVASASVNNAVLDPLAGYTADCDIDIEYTFVDECPFCTEFNTCDKARPSCGLDPTFYDYVGKTQPEVETELCSEIDPLSCDEVAGHIECITQDNILPDSNAAKQLKADNLLAWIASPELGQADSADQDDLLIKLVSRAQLVYEHYGASLGGRTRDGLRALYETHPSTLTCGSSASPTALALCPSLAWKLDFCARLSSSHINADVFWNPDPDELELAVSSFCAELQGELQAASCVPTAAVDEAWAVSRAVLDKVGESFEVDFGLGKCETPSEVRSAAASKMLQFVDDWYVRSTVSPDTNRLDDELVGAVNDFYAHVHRAARVEADLLTALAGGGEGSPICESWQTLAEPDPEAPPTSILARALDHVTSLSFAAYRDVVVGALAVEGIALVAVVGRALEAFTGQLSAQSLSHDLACQIQTNGCNGPGGLLETPLSKMWRLLALLDRGSELAVVAGDPANLPDYWGPFFESVAQAGGALVHSLGIALDQTYNPDDLASVSLDEVPASALPAVNAILVARARDASYRESGLFDSERGRYLSVPVHSERRAAIANVLDGLVNDLSTEQSSIENGFLDAVRAYVNASDNASVTDRLETQRASLLAEIEQLGHQRDAHVLGARTESISDQLDRAWVDVNGSLNGTQYVSVQSISGPQGFQIKGAGRFVPSGSRDIGSTRVEADIHGNAIEPITVQRGEALRVTVAPQERWAPDCAVRSVEVLDDTGNAYPLGGAAMTGPEGYSVVWNANQFETEENTNGNRETIGVKAEICYESNPLFEVTGLSFRACAYADANFNWSHTNRSGSGATTSASLVSGLFLPRHTPFRAPAGSLLAVEMYPVIVNGLERLYLRDVRVIRSPSTVLVPAAPNNAPESVFFFVVNDLHGCNEGTDFLNVGVERVMTPHSHARATLEAAADALGYIRAQEPTLIAQRQILPNQLSAIENAAMALLPANVRNASDYPPALARVFSSLVIAERSRLEHAVRVANIDDRIDERVRELELVRRDIHRAQRASTLLRDLPRWSAASLDVDGLERHSRRLARDLNDVVLPVAELWYPSAYPASLPGALEQAPGASLIGLTPTLVTLGSDLSSGINTISPPPRTALPIGISFRRPGAAGNPLLGPVGGTFSNFPTVSDPARGAAVFAAIDAGEPVTLHVLPEDVYRQGSSFWGLSCQAELPVLRRLGVAVVNRNSQVTPATGELGGTVDIYRGSEAMFPTVAGPVVFASPFSPASPGSVVPPRFLGQTRIVPATEDNSAPGHPSAMVNEAWVLAGGSDPLGSSPFGEFTFDISNVAAQLHSGTASELVVYMEIEYQSGGMLSWIPGC